MRRKTIKVFRLFFLQPNAQTFLTTKHFRTAFLALDPSLKIETRPFWCNEAFYRYLKGEHQ